MCRKSIDTARKDILNNYTKIAIHYKVEIVKYAFLVVINIIEISSPIIYIFRHRSQIVRRSIKSSHFFAILMCQMGIGFIFLTLASILNDSLFIFTLFAFGPRIVTQLYGTPH